MAAYDLPDIYARALGPEALGLGHIYQANPSWLCYNYVIHISYVCTVRQGIYEGINFRGFSKIATICNFCGINFHG